MVKPDKELAIHVISIVGLVIAAHHFWPKGITYGEKEDWEKAYRRKHELAKHKARLMKHHLKDDLELNVRHGRTDESMRHYERVCYGGRERCRSGERRRIGDREERFEDGEYFERERPRYSDDDGFEYWQKGEQDDRRVARY
ncbi:hypothetical protein BJ878DRAFT_484307 [Calycina marina]|uniref:Uncharacterized protein n=1 Tax=Calycina marina TaxID=1763456 RepID=A0A9P8CAV8_9HELO|nr:hypothetical protein BJ878DRAFT_484307 [Calycina marina]